jgi:hypothetical protein
MSEKPISPLRRRMIEDMTVRNFVEKTHNDYIRHVRTFTAFLGRAPDTAAPEDLRLFQLHQTQAGVRAPSINGSVAALRFFFTVTLDRPEMARHLTQLNLGDMYLNGQGVAQDYAEAVKWVRKSADQGYSVAQARLGYMYLNGKGITQDNSHAPQQTHLYSINSQALVRSVVGTAKTNLFVRRSAGRAAPWLL